MSTLTEQPAPPTTMRASLLQRPGKISLETVDVPRTEDDQVLVRVAAVAAFVEAPSQA